MVKTKILKLSSVAVAVVGVIASSFLFDSENSKEIQSNDSGNNSNVINSLDTKVGNGTLTKHEGLYFASFENQQVDVVSDRIVLSVTDKLRKLLTDAQTKDATIDRLSGSANTRLTVIPTVLPNTFVFKVDALVGSSLSAKEKRAQMNEILPRLVKVPGVKAAEEDVLMFPVSTLPSDPMLEQQWYLLDSNVLPPVGSIRAQSAWTKAQGDGIVVAVVDTGITDHPDLQDNLLPGYDFVSDVKRSGDADGWDNNPSDLGDFVTASESTTKESPFFGCPESNSSWHGTHVSGIIAASSNATGVVGVAPKAKILPVRVLGKCGGYASDIAAGILWASGAPTTPAAPTNTNPAQIINMSLGGKASCPVFYSSAISLARNQGATVVVAAGNSNVDASTFAPANCSGVISVASVGKDGNKAFYSNYGSRVTIAAPGGDKNADGQDGAILSTYNSGTTSPSGATHSHAQGTSMAAPMVSGAIAVTMSGRTGLASADAAGIVVKQASPFPTNSTCKTGCGAGIVNVEQAVNISENLGADFYLDKILLSEYALIPNVPIDVSFTIGNKGNAVALGKIRIKQYLSATDTLSESSRLISDLEHTINIESSKTQKVTVKNIVVPSIDPGNYNLVIKIEPESVLLQPNSQVDDTKSTGQLPLATPQIAIIKKIPIDQAPAMVKYEMSVQPTSHFKRFIQSDIQKTWSFSHDEEKRKGTATSAVFNEAGTYTVTANIKYPGGYSQTVTDATTIRTPDPFANEIKLRYSNTLLREPVDVLAQIVKDGGHPRDRLRKIEWQINDGEKVERSTGIFPKLTAGEYTIKGTTTSLYGVVSSSTKEIVVIPNKPPVCTLKQTNYSKYSYVIFTSQCTDEDGRIRSYEWNVNGSKITNSRNSYTHKYTGNGSVEVVLSVTDDSGSKTNTTSSFTH